MSFNKTILTRAIMMNKRLLTIAALASVVMSATAADVGVSVQIGQPGFYGQLEIGNMPQPRVIYAAPVIIQRAPVTVVTQPIYLRVPPGHEKNWRKHCHKYNACGQPVYFVQQNWYSNVYAPGYRRDHGEDEGAQHGNRGKGHEKSKNKGRDGH